MSNDEDSIIDAEIVPNLPAVIERTHESTTSFKAERIETEEEREVRRASLSGRDWIQGPKPERRCTAHSSRTGLPCKNAAIQGHNVCRFHGGAARQIKQAARNRLDNAADRMARELLGIALDGETEQLRLAAIRDALDRIGITKPTEVVLSQGNSKPWEEVYEGIAGLSRDQSRRARGVLEPDDPTAPAFASSAEQPSEYEDMQPEYVERHDVSPTYQHRADPASDVPLEDPPRRDSDRERDAQQRGEASRRVVHVVGDDALRVAAELTREQLALESRHKRYKRPW